MGNPERDTIIRAQKGDAEAFGQLVKAYNVQVYNLCYRMLGNRQEAEDASQEAFLRAYLALKRFDLERPFVNWLLTIASRYCIDQLRRRRLQTTPIDDLLERSFPDSNLGPEASLSRSESQQQMQAMLGTLKPTDRAAVVMHYWYDFSYEEIGEALSLTISAVKSRLHRARRELALRWQELDQPHYVPQRERHGSPAF